MCFLYITRSRTRSRFHAYIRGFGNVHVHGYIDICIHARTQAYIYQHVEVHANCNALLYNHVYCCFHAYGNVNIRARAYAHVHV